MASMTEKTYAGMITEQQYGENIDALFIGYEYGDEPFAADFEYELSVNGRYVSVRYFISDEPKSLDELEDSLIRVISGDGEADYGDAYSEITGYLWTNEECKVGGHDLLDELRTYVGKYCHLIAEFSKGGPVDEVRAAVVERLAETGVPVYPDWTR